MAVYLATLQTAHGPCAPRQVGAAAAARMSKPTRRYGQSARAEGARLLGALLPAVAAVADAGAARGEGARPAAWVQRNLRGLWAYGLLLGITGGPASANSAPAAALRAIARASPLPSLAALRDAGGGGGGGGGAGGPPRGVPEAELARSTSPPPRSRSGTVFFAAEAGPFFLQPKRAQERPRFGTSTGARRPAVPQC
jgi:hypothetical protein